MSTKLEQYDLYLDETGLFDEGSDARSDVPGMQTPRQKGLSQLVGLLMPRNTGDADAREITRAANVNAQRSRDSVIHGYDIIKYSSIAYLNVVRSIITDLKQRHDWQCVRLVNVERIAYFDRSINYPNLVAELVLRTFQQRLKDAPGVKTCIRLIDPKYKLSKIDPPLSAQEYERRIPEYLGFAEVRYGLARQSRNWRFDGVVQREYRESAALQICDILSHASADKWERIRKEKDLITILDNLLGEYDFTLTIAELFDRVDDLIKESSFGMALIVLAETLVDTPTRPGAEADFVAKVKQRLDEILERLSRTDSRGRDPQLALLVSWLDQIIGHQRLIDKGYELAQWVLDKVDAPLRRLSSPREQATLDWFAYAVRRWALTACNHKGLVIKGESEVNAMKALQPSVARQWERIPLVMDGLIAQAVHATDCLDFDEASKLMSFVAESLKNQSNRFHEFLPNEFPETLNFDLRARALGTLVQSEIFAGVREPRRLANARGANDHAIAEFTSFGDRARQYQYRCHLETVARDFEAARRFLVQSMEGTDQTPSSFTHDRIAELILESRRDPEWKAEFNLVHWLRIGAYACLAAHEARRSDMGREVAGAESERDDFLAALDKSGQLNSEGCQGRVTDYPAHSILRFVAVVQAARGLFDEAIAAVRHLHRLDPIGKGQVTLSLILLAAQAEVTVLAWSQNEFAARGLLQNGLPDVKPLSALTSSLDDRIKGGPDQLSAQARKWRAAVRTVKTESSAFALLELARLHAF